MVALFPVILVGPSNEADGDFESASDADPAYTLVARLDDNGNQIVESIETNNELTFAGGVFQAPLGTLQVHGGPGAATIDTVAISPNGTLLDVTLNGIKKSFTATGVPAIHVRTHGGNDMVTRGAIDALMSLWGADGDDTLTVDGVAAMPSTASKFDPGAGSNSFNANSGNVYLDTFWNSVNDPVAALTTTVQGGAELNTNRLWQNGLLIQENSRVKLLPDGGFDNPPSILNSVEIEAGSTLDITNQALIIDYTGGSPVSTIRTLIISGRGGTGLNKTWNGTGITSSTAASAPVNSYSVGYAENSGLSSPYNSSTRLFRGVAVDGTCVLIAYTRTGDADLDGVVENDDTAILGAYYAPGSYDKQWYQGDFEYNGAVDNDDVTLLGAYYNPSAAPA